MNPLVSISQFQQPPTCRGPPYLPLPHYFEKKKEESKKERERKKEWGRGGKGKEGNPRHLCHFVHKQVSMYLKKGKDLFFT